MKYFTLLLLFPFITANAQNDKRKIVFPDVDGYVTIVADLHQHTVFSDGSVWPDIRVREALFDGVDAISLTEHIEYQPHKDDIPHPDRNRSYEIARKYAEGKDLIVIPGAEITRSMPPGHANALFIQDANKLVLEDPIDMFREAKNQGAFTFWNHPNWTAQRKDGIARLEDLHRQLMEENLLHGIEVVNETTYSEEALSIAQQNGLTVLGTSDIHGLIDWMFGVADGGHRPVTLVFASEKTEAGIKEGLIAGRTVAWHRNILIGNKENLQLLVEASLRVKEAAYRQNTNVLRVVIVNTSDARFILRNLSAFTFHENADLITIEPETETSFQLKTGDVLESVSVTFEVLNAIEGPGKNYTKVFDIQPE